MLNALHSGCYGVSVRHLILPFKIASRILDGFAPWGEIALRAGYKEEKKDIPSTRMHLHVKFQALFRTQLLEKDRPPLALRIVLFSSLLELAHFR